MGSTSGRKAIFTGKIRTRPLRGVMTAAGWKALEAARVRLAKLAHWHERAASVGDTVEYLARGREETERMLREKEIP